MGTYKAPVPRKAEAARRLIPVSHHRHWDFRGLLVVLLDGLIFKIATHPNQHRRNIIVAIVVSSMTRA
jgi:hypothetical protein